VFGQLIGKQLEEMWQILGQPPFTIVEYGAGTGALCRDILSYLKQNHHMYDQLRYCIIEKSPVMRDIEKGHLGEKVSWHDSIEDIPDIIGCVLSNELVDTFAVQPVVMDQQLLEVWVDYDTDFKELLLPASEELNNYLDELTVTLPPGFRTEINLQALGWIESIAAHLQQGYVMTIDYGYESENLYQPGRCQGTLRCYRNHTTNQSLYEHIGLQDMTTYVNFSALRHWGAKQGLAESGLTDQGHFLLAMGFNDAIRASFSGEPDILQAARSIATISHRLLLDMGPKFKVLIQQKGVPDQPLKGLGLGGEGKLNG
jgi:SAM-dependent MidA family methyltransferase